MKISKELVSEVFKLNICEAYVENNTLFFDMGLPLIQSINLYEFAFKCKEWANTQDYWTQSGYEINHLGNYFCMIKDMPDNQFFYANTEIEAIIKACEYILKELNENR